MFCQSKNISFTKCQSFNQEDKNVLTTCKGLTMKIWKFFQENFKKFQEKKV